MLLKVLMVPVAVVLGVLAVPTAGVQGPLAPPAGCPQNCERCGRTDATVSNTCGPPSTPSVQSNWSDLGGSDGCCYAPDPPCPSLACEWIGNLSIRVISGGPAGIVIYGPGTSKSCASVPDGSFCTKSFDGGPTNPSIVASCPNDWKEVTSFISVGGGVSCSIIHRFNCGSCP